MPYSKEPWLAGLVEEAASVGFALQNAVVGTRRGGCTYVQRGRGQAWLAHHGQRALQGCKYVHTYVLTCTHTHTTYIRTYMHTPPHPLNEQVIHVSVRTKLLLTYLCNGSEEATSDPSPLPRLIAEGDLHPSWLPVAGGGVLALHHLKL